MATGDAESANRARRNRPVAAWLLACCVLVFAMVILGGVTRLTGSGLSMVNWQPVSGVVPPLTRDAWEREFAHYRDSPEYKLVNYGMRLAEFKRIFWFEFAHRLLGRLIGIVFLLPFVYFLMRRRIEPSLAPKLAMMFVLGALQGLLGWYMVRSGLVDDPHVSQYRLAAHLGLAVLVYALMLWTALGLMHSRAPRRGVASPGLPAFAMPLTVIVFVAMLSGAFVAGLKAGYTYNTFPLMAGQWVPEGLWAMTPAYRNLFENVATVQFSHRLLAVATFLAIVSLWVVSLRARLPRSVRLWSHAVALAAVIQVILGISTLLARVPVSLAALHQAGALVLLTVLLCLAFESRMVPYRFVWLVWGRTKVTG